MRRRLWKTLITAIFFILLYCCIEAKTHLRVGHFPTITHAQAVIAHGMTRQGKGWFESRLGPDVKIDWYIYNSGPSAVEGIFIDSIDLTYVGPVPTINGYLKSLGKELRIISGACSGGSALVVQGNGSIKSDQDFKDKIIATPQYGNTQDIAARTWLKSKGYNIAFHSGDVKVIPTAIPEQLLQFQRGVLDGVWTVEPWVSQLELEANGNVYLEEKTIWKQTSGKYVSTHLVSSVKFLKNHPDLARKWIAAQLELTEWIVNNPDKAKELFNSEMEAEVRKKLPQPVLDKAWARIELTYDPIKSSLLTNAANAYALGFIKQPPDLSTIYALQLLNELLREKGVQEIR